MHASARASAMCARAGAAPPRRRGRRAPSPSSRRTHRRRRGTRRRRRASPPAADADVARGARARRLSSEEEVAACAATLSAAAAQSRRRGTRLAPRRPPRARLAPSLRRGAASTSAATSRVASSAPLGVRRRLLRRGRRLRGGDCAIASSVSRRATARSAWRSFRARRPNRGRSRVYGGGEFAGGVLGAARASSAESGQFAASRVASGPPPAWRRASPLGSRRARVEIGAERPRSAAASRAASAAFAASARSVAADAFAAATAASASARFRSAAFARPLAFDVALRLLHHLRRRFQRLLRLRGGHLAPDWKNDRSDSRAETRVLSVASPAERSRLGFARALLRLGEPFRPPPSVAAPPGAVPRPLSRRRPSGSSRADSSSPASGMTLAWKVCRRPSTRASRAVSSACSSARVAATSSAAAAVTASSAFRSSNCC